MLSIESCFPLDVLMSQTGVVTVSLDRLTDWGVAGKGNFRHTARGWAIIDDPSCISSSNEAAKRLYSAYNIRRV